MNKFEHHLYGGWAGEGGPRLWSECCPFMVRFPCGQRAGAGAPQVNKLKYVHVVVIWGPPVNR